MAFYRKSGGGNVTPTIVKRRSGGAWVTPATIKRRSGGSWVTVWTAEVPLTASLSQSTINGTNSDTTVQGTVTSDNVACNTSGGTGAAKTYTWRNTGGSTAITAVNPNSASTAFTRTGVQGIVTSTFVCDVSDGTYSATTGTLTVNLEYIREGV